MLETHEYAKISPLITETILEDTTDLQEGLQNVLSAHETPRCKDFLFIVLKWMCKFKI